jgi:hypothetical protein
VITENYLTEDEIKLLGLLGEQFLAFAETMAQQRTPMHMANCECSNEGVSSNIATFRL